MSGQHAAAAASGLPASALAAASGVGYSPSQCVLVSRRAASCVVALPPGAASSARVHTSCHEVWLAATATSTVCSTALCCQRL